MQDAKPAEGHTALGYDTVQSGYVPRFRRNVLVYQAIRLPR